MIDGKSVLVVEISGKRPGSKKERPTEYFNPKYDFIIISNDSNGYDTDWPIVNVPADYVEWYKKSLKSSDSAWYAPMNRSYAIKYAREHGYKYLVQLDDNINMLQIAYKIKQYENDEFVIYRQYRAALYNNRTADMANDFIDMAIIMLQNTNAGIAGFNMGGACAPGSVFLRERYCYSFFALNIDVVPNEYQGDFEDDIDFRLKCFQMGIPSIQCATMMYAKTSAIQKNDSTGCRKAYADAGIKRGEHMRKLYGDVYKAGMSSRTNAAVKQKIKNGETHFKHKLGSQNIGVLIKDRKQIDDFMAYLFKKYSEKKKDQIKCNSEVKR